MTFSTIASAVTAGAGALWTSLPLLRDASVDLVLGGADGARSLVAFLVAAAIAASSAIAHAATSGASAASEGKKLGDGKQHTQIGTIFRLQNCCKRRENAKPFHMDSDPMHLLGVLLRWLNALE